MNGDNVFSKADILTGIEELVRDMEGDPANTADVISGLKGLAFLLGKANFEDVVLQEDDFAIDQDIRGGLVPRGKRGCRAVAELG